MLWCILLLVVTVSLVACWLMRLGVPCEEKWPPISEEEFLRRCSPGVDRERALKVRRIISNHLGVDYDRVYPEQRFVEDLGCD